MCSYIHTFLFKLDILFLQVYFDLAAWFLVLCHKDYTLTIGCRFLWFAWFIASSSGLVQQTPLSGSIIWNRFIFVLCFHQWEQVIHFHRNRWQNECQLPSAIFSCYYITTVRPVMIQFAVSFHGSLSSKYHKHSKAEPQRKRYDEWSWIPSLFMF